MRQDDYYQLFGVNRKASRDEVKRAFRLRIRDVHPDRHPENTLANDSARKLIEAYRTLSDPVRRKCYDHSLAPMQPVFAPHYCAAPPPQPRTSRTLPVFASIALVVVCALLLAHTIVADARPDYSTFGTLTGAPVDETENARFEARVFDLSSLSQSGLACNVADLTTQIQWRAPLRIAP